MKINEDENDLTKKSENHKEQKTCSLSEEEQLYEFANIIVNIYFDSLNEKESITKSSDCST
jgi:hypothetical protein